MILRRFAGALALAVAGVLLTALPSYALTYSQSCDSFYDSLKYRETLCVWAQWHNHSGDTGITVTQVGAFVQGPGWENGNPPAVSGDHMVLKNDSGSTKWYRDTNVDVVSTSDPAGPFILNGGNGISLPNTPRAWVTYVGYLRLDHQPDPGSRSVTVVMFS